MTANRLYFAQHGLAEDKKNNPERPLTEEGFKQTQNVARQLLPLNLPISRIFHSGKLRAEQTAEIFASILDIKELTMRNDMSPGDDINLLKNNLTIDDALYVGHLPHLEKLVSVLVAGSEGPGIIKFRNSAILCLENNGDLYQIAWYMTPQIAHIHYA